MKFLPAKPMGILVLVIVAVLIANYVQSEVIEKD